MDKFFGSKLNSVLLIVLIILMIIAIKIMRRNEAIYFPFLAQNETEQNKSNEEINSTDILGNKDDLVFFSILPGSKVSGIVSYNGIIKGGYFFEANILINILDADKKAILQSHSTAKDNWMTSGPVNFEGKVDFSALPKGPAFFEIHNDNASGLKENDKSVLIPIVID